jgi:hypothetical protein
VARLGIEQEVVIGDVLVICEHERRARFAGSFGRCHSRHVQFHAQADRVSVRILEENLGGDGPDLGTAQQVVL